ncbi:unnamed protein product [Eruca vesicaria subsp. sativa]|uniref:RING-type E3 ubiquitin transferase n=1 Tax=Eruca vesicaria subsp. sativa TaxID=29727 RepID=A0ABC8K2V5_ERUVS|nr:unnamed protein product [Eruca vesicaria subsp. sativa]
MGCCCCLPILPESSRAIDEHVPLSHPSSSSVVPTDAVNTNLASNIYTAPLQPPLHVSFSPRNPSKIPTTQSNSSQEAKHTLPEKQTWPVGDQSDINIKKKDQEFIDECPICLEEYEPENPRLLTKCRHDFHLACILEWMERSEACPVCDQELVLPES